MQKCPNPLSARGQDREFTLMGTMDLGSWFTQSSLPIYGDDHVIDNKNQYNCHALMITLSRLYVLKHIVERSTHMCY